jgi:CRP-like cAMP-binding protein
VLDAATALAGSIPFSELDESERRVLDELGRPVPVEEGQIIWHKGDELDAAYILLSGSVFERRPDRVAVYSTPGALFGVGAWLSGGPSEYAAKGASDALLLAVSRADFEGLIVSHSRLGRTLLDLVILELAGRVRELNQTLNDLVAKTQEGETQGGDGADPGAGD